eukprot:6038001-Alexandrium_andersonii.AAC.1
MLLPVLPARRGRVMGQRTLTHRTGDGAPPGAGVGGMTLTGAVMTSGPAAMTGGVTTVGRSAT